MTFNQSVLQKELYFPVQNWKSTRLP